MVVAESDRHLLASLRRASAIAIPRCIVSRYAKAWAESLEGAMSGHQSWTVLHRYRCRLLQAEVPKGTDRNAESEHRLQLWEQATKNPGTATLRTSSQEEKACAIAN